MQNRSMEWIGKDWIEKFCRSSAAARQQRWKFCNAAQRGSRSEQRDSATSWLSPSLVCLATLFSILHRTSASLSRKFANFKMLTSEYSRDWLVNDLWCICTCWLHVALHVSQYAEHAERVLTVNVCRQRLNPSIQTRYQSIFSCISNHWIAAYLPETVEY